DVTLDSLTAAGDGAINLNITAGENAVSATDAVVVVKGVGKNGVTHTASLLLQVAGLAVANDFSISASPGSRTLVAGSSANFTVATSVTSGSAESVALSATGLPAGVTPSFSPPS